MLAWIIALCVGAIQAVGTNASANFQSIANTLAS
jgi:hypothetical protein